MRSIVTALTWESCRRSWIIALVVIPAFIAMLSMAMFESRPWALSFDAFHFVTTITFLLAAVTVLWTLCDPSEASRRCHLCLPRWLFTLPLPTWALVAWQMFLGMALGAAVHLVFAGTLNLAFDLDWPVWLPALSLAVVMAVVLGGTWLLVGSPLMQAIFLVAVWFAGYVLAFWLLVFFWDQPLEAILEDASPRRLWSAFSAGGWLTMAGLVAGSYLAAVWSVARVRRGEPGLVAWLVGPVMHTIASGLDRVWLPGRRSSRFRSADAALFRSTCRQLSIGRVSLLPFAIFAAAMATAYLGSLGLLPVSFARPIVAWGIVLPIVIQVAIVARGVVAGVRDPSAHAAALPIENVPWSRIVLRSNALAALITTAMFLLFLSLYLAPPSVLMGDVRNVQFQAHDRGGLTLRNLAITLAIVFLVHWSLLGLAWPLREIARGRMRVLIAIGLFFVAYMATAILWVPRSVGGTMMDILAAAVAIALIAWSFTVYRRAHRRAMIKSWAIPAAIATWLLLCGGWVYIFFISKFPQQHLYSLTVEALPAILYSMGWLALPMVPFAAVPLALERFRHQ